ncbi:MAG: helix-turn-helix domain-containing protein [Actinobacteria bacterium]|nr:helix-turn-helix domain-containing protein [Actinomycetota bacterium]
MSSARRVLQILLQFSEDHSETTVEEVAQLHAISLPSAHRYLALLREMYLVEERMRGVYVLSPQVLRLSSAAERSLNLATTSRPILQSLVAETQSTALIVKRIRDAAVCVAAVQPNESLAISFQPGHVMPLHRGAAAKVLLAAWTPLKRAEYLENHCAEMGTRQLRALEKELAAISEQGIAESESEVDSGIYAVAAPVSFGNQIVGAISLVAPSFAAGPRQRAKMRKLVLSASTDVSRLLLTD